MISMLLTAQRAATVSLALLIVACNQQPTESSSETSSIVELDPCVIALTSHAAGSVEADRSIARFQQRIERQTPPLTANYERLGWAYIAKARDSFDPGFYTLAEQTARCMRSRHPGAAADLLLGNALHNLHRFGEAESLGRMLVQSRGAWFDYALLGDVLVEQGDFDGAATAYQEMLNQRPGPQSYSRAAHLRWLLGDLVGAIEMMEKSVRASSLRNREATAWVRVRLAYYLLQAGNPERSLALVSSALELKPDYPPAMLLRGHLLIANRRYTEATEVLRRASELNPLPEYQWALIEVLEVDGRPAQAATVKAKLTQHGASSDPRTLALYLATRGENVETAARLARSELKSRADPLTLDVLAWSLYAAGQIEEAADVSARAMAHNTADARLFYHAGVIAAAANRTEQAVRWLARARKIQQMLLPSEQRHLRKEFAALRSQVRPLAANHNPAS